METREIIVCMEEICEGVVTLLTTELPSVIEEINTERDYGIELEDEVTIKHDSPASGFSLLGVDEYPAVFIEPLKEREEGVDEKGFQILISGWLREEDLRYMIKKIERFALAVKTTLKKDFTLDGIASGGVIADTDYLEPMKSKRDPTGSYISFVMDVSYINYKGE